MFKWLSAKLATAASVVANSFRLISYFKPTEVPEAVMVANMALNTIKACDWHSDSDVEAVIDGVLAAMNEAADTTVTLVDDIIAENLTELAGANKPWLINAIQYFAATDESPELTPVAKAQAFAELKPPPARMAGDDATTATNPLVWVELAALLWTLIKPLLRK